MWAYCGKCGSREPKAFLEECDFCGDNVCRACDDDFEALICCGEHARLMQFCCFKCAHDYRLLRVCCKVY
jgi:hypothetical protein